MLTTSMDARSRLLKLHSDHRVADALIAKNFHSAVQIADMAPSHFVRLMTPHLAGGKDTARQVHARATQIRSTVLHAWSNVKSIVRSPHYKALSITNIGGDIAEQFELLPSYAEFFGPVDYYACEECQSIFGAAAYLVDLLRIIDTYVTAPNTIPDHLKLDARRDDLGQIPLTCANTNTTFPLLNIVNERLGKKARDVLNLTADQDLFEVISTLTYPFTLALHLPMVKISVSLAQINMTVADLYGAFGASAIDVGCARLNLSGTAYTFLTHSLADDAAQLSASYGVAQSALGTLSDVTTLLASTGMSPTDLQHLLTQNLSDAELEKGVAANFFINSGLDGKTLYFVAGDDKTGTPASIANLNPDALDRISRFVRLARHLSWDYALLDWALRVASAGSTPQISSATLTLLAEMIELADMCQLDLAALCNLLGPVKTYGAGNASVSSVPFDELFNDPRVLGQKTPYRPAPNALNPLFTSQVVSWTVAGVATDDLVLSARLCGALGVSADTLHRLAGMLFPGSTTVPLSIDNLSTLYRHAVLLRVTGLPADQHMLFMALGQWSKPSLSAVELRNLLVQRAWLEHSGTNVYQIDYFLNGQTGATVSPFVNPLYRISSVGEWLDLVGQSTQGLGPLTARHEKLESLLATFFGIATDMLATLIKLVINKIPLPAPSTTWQDAFIACADQTSGPSPYVSGVLDGLSRWLVIANALDAPQALLNSLSASPANATAFGMTDPSLTALVFADVITLSTFVQQMDTFQDVNSGLIHYVELTASSASPDDCIIQLSQVTQWDCVQLEALLPSVATKNRTAAVAELQHQFDLLHQLGADSHFMQHMLSVTTSSTASWADYTQQADLVLAKIKGVIPDTQWCDIALHLDGAVAEQMRGFLAPFVLSRLADLNSLRELSEYLLIDVEVSGVRQISYIREALNAALLYLQRCRLRLENGVDELDIPQAWWAWMMNYRMWEANRQIFLYPENYIDPTLRQSQTRLFTDLRNQLQQNAITDQSVDATYREYLDNLCKLAQLVYVDAYQGTVHDPQRGAIDTTFLFARTATEPYNYSYISYDTQVWSEWKPIDITIPAALVTPVYVFNHLFLFWVELKTSRPATSDGASGQRGVAYSASIKYSFTRFDSSWIQPQALISDEVVYFMPSESDQQGALGPLASAPELFHMTDIFWNKVAVNIVPGNTGQNDKLCVMYGPFLDKGLTATALQLPAVPAPLINDTSSQLSFKQTVFDIAATYNQFFKSSVLGHLPMMNTALLDRDLNPSFLARPNEVIVLEKESGESAPPLFKPEIDTNFGTLKLVATASAYQANYLTDFTPPYSTARMVSTVTEQSFISSTITAQASRQCFVDLQANYVVDANGLVSPRFGPATDLSFLFAGAPADVKDRLTFDIRKSLFLMMGDPTLFATLPVPTARLVSVKNQPGSFMLDTGDESYLLTPQGADYAPLSASTEVAAMRSSPIVYDVYFAPVDPNQKAYSQIYADLSSNHVIESVSGTYGWLSANFTADSDLSFLFAGAQPNAKATMITQVRHILLNLPSLTKLRYAGNKIRHVVTPSSFVSNDINTSASQQAFTDLKANNIIDTNGLVTASFNEQTPLDFLFSGASQPLKDQMTAQVRAVLLTLPKLVQLTSFVSNTIDAATSQTVFAALIANHIIDTQGMLAVSFTASSSLSFLFTDMPEPKKTALTEEVRAVLLRFYHSTYQIDTHALGFDVARISARASARELAARMFVGGVEELLALETQNAPVIPKVPFDRLSPLSAVTPPAQYDGAQIDFNGPYGEYYWELFFHAPMLVADALALDQQYADAKRWLEYILNPTAQEQFVGPGELASTDIDPAHAQAAYTGLLTLGFLKEVTPGCARVTAAFTPNADLRTLFVDIQDSSLRALMLREVANVLGNFQLAQPASHFWQFRPFRNHTLQSLKAILTDTAQIATYNNDPFDPHAIARLRIGAYEKAIVMKYIDNLIAWGDMQFSQYTWESINSATLLYMYANSILGDKPVNLGPCPAVTPMSFNEIKAHYANGNIPQFLLDLENWLSPELDTLPAVRATGDAFNALDAYFCVPENAMLTTYWDRVTDRLDKIRNGLNIDGVAVPLTLFDPPIDPMALVKLAASGSGMLGVLASGGQSISSQYRFGLLFEQAQQLTSVVMQLGSALQSALERNDAEQLEALRQTQELAILDLSTSIKEKQIEQLQSTLDALVKSQQRAQQETSYFTGLDASGLSSQEVASRVCLAEAILFQSLTVPIRGISIAGYLSPSIFGLADGGMKWGDAIATGAEISSAVSQSLQLAAQLTATTGEQQRRSDEWLHQANLNTQEADILQQQIEATHVQITMARQDLITHKKSIEQANTVGTFLRSRFTSTDLYQWMAGRLAGVYFQAYRMAVDAAKAAEIAYQYVTTQNDTFINLGYWDSLKKGLLAGEALQFSLQQLKQAYMAGNVRRLEISKTISLLQLDPEQILNLRQGKEATFSLTETMFDFDFPGHYARQIASVAISIPAVAGPYQNLNATLTQTKNQVAISSDPAVVEYLLAVEHPVGTSPPKQPDASQLRVGWLASQSIAISRAMNDNGMFELNFTAERYMPFEGTGAVSDWTLSIPPENNRINLDQLSDVIIELKYTALDGVGKNKVNDLLRKYNVQFASKLYLNARQMFASDWQAFMTPQGPPVTQTLSLGLTRTMFPYFKSMTANTAAIRLTTAAGVTLSGPSFIALVIGSNRYELVFGANGIAPVPPAGTATLGLTDADFLVPWLLHVTLANVPDPQILIKDKKLNPQGFLNLEIILSYSADVLGN